MYLFLTNLPATLYFREATSQVDMLFNVHLTSLRYSKKETAGYAVSVFILLKDNILT